jgi:hypothetical protein
MHSKRKSGEILEKSANAASADLSSQPAMDL